MDEGRLLLSGGAVARAPGPWEGTTASADVDIRGRVMSASGPAEVRGPGLTVTGRNLSWRWGEGIVSLDAPKSRIEPARLRAMRKEG